MPIQRNRISSILLVLLLLMAASPALLMAQQTEAQSKALARAASLLAHHHIDEARKLYEKTDKQSRNSCAACELALANLNLNQHRYKDAAHWAGLATKNDSRPSMAAAALEIEGTCDSARAGKSPKDKHLLQAEQEFRQATLLDPTHSTHEFHLATILLREKRIEEGKAALTAFLRQQPQGPSRQMALLLLRHPELVNARLAPMFVSPLRNGGAFSLAAQQGKVVVLDFWATWCPPCVKALPDMIRFVQRQQGKPVVIVSISGDTDRNQWLRFTREHHMDWPQIYDGSGQLRRAYGIYGIPTWVVLDGEGVEQRRLVGYGFGRESNIEQAVKDAVKHTEAEQHASNNAATVP